MKRSQMREVNLSFCAVVGDEASFAGVVNNDGAATLVNGCAL